MTSSATLRVTVEELREAANDICPPGRLVSLAAHRVKLETKKFLALLFDFDPTGGREENYERVDEILSNAIATLKGWSLHERDPFYPDAISRIVEARELIAAGYSPAKPPSDEHLKTVTEEQANRLLAVLDKSPA